MVGEGGGFNGGKIFNKYSPMRTGNDVYLFQFAPVMTYICQLLDMPFGFLLVVNKTDRRDRKWR